MFLLIPTMASACHIRTVLHSILFALDMGCSLGRQIFLWEIQTSLKRNAAAATGGATPSSRSTSRQKKRHDEEGTARDEVDTRDANLHWGIWETIFKKWHIHAQCAFHLSKPATCLIARGTEYLSAQMFCTVSGTIPECSKHTLLLSQYFLSKDYQSK